MFISNEPRLEEKCSLGIRQAQLATLAFVRYSALYIHNEVNITVYSVQFSVQNIKDKNIS